MKKQKKNIIPRLFFCFLFSSLYFFYFLCPFVSVGLHKASFQRKRFFAKTPDRNVKFVKFVTPCISKHKCAKEVLPGHYQESSYLF